MSDNKNNKNNEKETLRDKFAMAALSSAAQIISDRSDFFSDTVAKVAYEIADEMLKVREEK